MPIYLVFTELSPPKTQFTRQKNAMIKTTFTRKLSNDSFKNHTIIKMVLQRDRRNKTQKSHRIPIQKSAI